MTSVVANQLILVLEALALTIVGVVALYQLLHGQAVSAELNQIIQVILALILAHNTAVTARLQNRLNGS